MTPIRQRLRIVHCLGTLRLAGTEKEVLSYLEYGDRDRFENIVVLPAGEGPLLGLLRERGATIHQTGERAVLKKARLFRRLKVDLVHVLASRLDALAGRLAGAKVVAKRNLPIRGYASPFMRRPLYDRTLNRLAHLTVTVAEALKTDLVENGRFDPDRVVVVPNGIELDAYRPAAKAVDAVRRAHDLPGPDSGIPLVGAVGRLHPQKGLEFLIEAVPLVLEQHPSALFLIAGDGELETSLKTAAARLGGAGDSIRFLGFVREIPAFLNCLDLFVLPSLWEGMPFAILEAMAAGITQVVSDVDGCRELVVEGETGLLVPPREPSRLAEGINLLLGDRALRRRMGEAARERTGNRFSPQRSAAMLDDVFRRLCT